MRRPLLVLLSALAVSACSVLGAVGTPTVTIGSAVPPSTTTPVVRRCLPIGRSAGERIAGRDAAETAVALARAVFDCADEVVVTDAGNAGQIAVGAQLAAALGGPLLLSTPAADWVAEELRRLAPRKVTVIGEAPLPVLPAGTVVERFEGPLNDLADVVRRQIGAVARVGVADTGVAAAAEVLRSIATRRTVTVPREEPVAGCSGDLAAAGDAMTRAADVPSGRGEVWLVDVCSPLEAMIAGAAVARTGGTVLLVDGGDLRATADSAIDVLRARAGGLDRVHLVGDITADGEWQLRSVLSGTELPGGGLLLFPGRRIVSLYGNPTTGALGVLGEQGPERAAARAREVAAGYGADGVPVIPGFEIIATVASSRPGDDGDYSWEMTVDQLRPWVETAAQEGLYVTLDLQPGRTDFLTQAKRYEQLLVLPNVGLALDPEWRLKPDQRHLRQIGSVDAAEVNQVIDYLTELVREHALPQKLLILHQFRLSMITNREAIETPPELAVVVHADGQGPIHTKYDTYDALLAPPDASRWWWGWKNFYDEDSPTPTPAQVLDLDPVPVYVSYQ